MTSDNWELLKDLFEQALACDSPEERRDFLANKCGDDAVLRSELESLLAELSRKSAAFLDPAPADLRRLWSFRFLWRSDEDRVLHTGRANRRIWNCSTPLSRYTRKSCQPARDM